MNRNILSIVVLLLPLQVAGQMFPLSNQYLNNPLAINPAFAGCHDALSATVLYRTQWIGFKDAPKSTILSVHSPLFYDKIGLGLLVDRNSVGIFRETNLIGNYAYRIGLPQGKLALGIGFGATVSNIAWNELDATDPDDALLINNPPSKVLPDFSIGSYYYSDKYFIGFSIPMFLSHELNNSGRYKIRNRFSEYNYFFTSGYLFNISPWIDLLPSCLIKYHPGHSPQADINAQLILKNRIWIGIGYQNKDVIIGMLQCQLNDQLKMSYSHDFDTGTVGKYKRGSNEFVLNYTFKYLRKVSGPRQF
jgi:type IX secretion system PorP/SprF family membrane protein